MSRNWNKNSYPVDEPRKPGFKGGKHICRIVYVDDSNADYTEIYLDVDDANDSANQFFNQRSNGDLSKWWTWGKRRIYLYDKDSVTAGEPKMSLTYSRLISALEASNPGYDFDQTGYNEQTWVGKHLVAVWKEKIKKEIDGNEKSQYNILFFASIDSFNEISVPDPDYIQDELPGVKKESSPKSNYQPSNVPDVSFIDEDDIPF